MIKKQYKNQLLDQEIQAASYFLSKYSRKFNEKSYFKRLIGKKCDL